MREQSQSEMREHNHEEMREERSTNPDSERSHPTTPQPFTDLSSLGLCRSGRKKTKCKFYGFLIMATALQSNISSTTANIYHKCVDGYDDYLDLNFDGTNNSTSILGQIYLSGKMNNEIYTLKEMMKQPDRKNFEEAMHKKVQDMFDNQI